MKKIIACALILSMLSSLGAVCFAKNEDTQNPGESTPMTLEYIDPEALPDESTVEEPERDADDASTEEQQPADEEAQVDEDADTEYSEAPEAEDEQEEKESAKDLPVGTRIKNWFKNDFVNFFKKDVKNFIKNNFEWLVVGAVAVAAFITIGAVSANKKEKAPEDQYNDKVAKEAKFQIDVANKIEELKSQK